MRILQNCLAQARQIRSSNFDARPDQTDIDLIVIHCISLPPGNFGGNSIDKLFLNQLNPNDHPYFESLSNLKVSSHVLIDRKGQITQYVPFHLRAWHAGRSNFEGREACNDFSIGIELEGTEDIAYTDAQYAHLARLIKALIEHYPKLSQNRIVGHSAIAPDRKTDPGNSFDWAKLRRSLAALSISK